MNISDLGTWEDNFQMLQWYSITSKFPFTPTLAITKTKLHTLALTKFNGRNKNSHQVTEVNVLQSLTQKLKTLATGKEVPKLSSTILP